MVTRTVANEGRPVNARAVPKPSFARSIGLPQYICRLTPTALRRTMQFAMDDRRQDNRALMRLLKFYLKCDRHVVDFPPLYSKALKIHQERPI